MWLLLKFFAARLALLHIHTRSIRRTPLRFIRVRGVRRCRHVLEARRDVRESLHVSPLLSVDAARAAGHVASQDLHHRYVVNRR